MCAALIAVFIGAGFFPAQSAAGQVIGQVTSPLTLQGAAAIDQLKQDGQYDLLQTALDQARLSVSRAENTPLGRWAWHAPNQAAGYDAYITEKGVSIAVNDGAYVSLSLHSLGYGAALREVAPGEVSGDKQTINIARDGGVREWYVNGPDGLEQGFTLAESPGAQQAGEPLRLTLQVSDDWRAAASEDGQGVTLRSADGQAVEYSKLVVRDSLERTIPARLAVAKEGVVIEVEDSDATYPLTIDPTFTLQQKLLAPDGAARDAFGLAVAVYGNTVVVGAYAATIGAKFYQGAAYVFTRSGTTWTQQQKLTASDGASGDQFGSEVAISGDTVVVGANRDTIDGRADQGSAYVFTRSGTTWTQQQKLTAFDGAASEFFGSAIAIYGDTVVFGVAHTEINQHVHQGSAYVFKRSGTTWTVQQKLTASDGAWDDWFGISVAIYGDTIAVGAYSDFITYVDQGSVYIFTRSGTYWTQQQRITASDPAEADFFGRSVALSNDTLVVGTPDHDNGTNYYQGAIYIFTRNGAGWTELQELRAADGEAFDSFGISVAISGDTMVVGADGDGNGLNTDQGSAYVFTRSYGYWSQRQKLTASDGAKDDTFGISVAISDDTLVAGAFSDDINANIDQGSAYVFYRAPCSTFVFSPAFLSDGLKGQPYQQWVTISNGGGPYHFARSSGTLPPGISLSSSGFLSGTPTTAGTYQFTLTATDLNTLCSGSRTYTLTVASCPTLVLDPPDIPNGAMGTPYSYTLAVLGGRPPYTFAAKGKTPGLSMSADGVLSGTPTMVGNFPFTLVISDVNGCSSTLACAITITESDGGSSVASRPGSGKR